jgi:hypothetical protein
MNKAVIAAIAGAINAYIEQEGRAKAEPSKDVFCLEVRSRRPFGRQELFGARGRGRVRRYNRLNTGLTLMWGEIRI